MKYCVKEYLHLFKISAVSSGADLLAGSLLKAKLIDNDFNTATSLHFISTNMSIDISDLMPPMFVHQRRICFIENACQITSQWWD